MDAAGAHRKEEDVMELGILTLLPPVVILLVARKTRNTTSSPVSYTHLDVYRRQVDRIFGTMKRRN